MGHRPGAGIAVWDWLVKSLRQERLQGAVPVVQKHHAGAIAGPGISVAAVRFRPPMGETAVRGDGILEEAPAGLTIEPRQDADPAGPLLPVLGRNAMGHIEMLLSRTLRQNVGGFNMIAQQHGTPSLRYSQELPRATVPPQVELLLHLVEETGPLPKPALVLQPHGRHDPIRIPVGAL